LAETADFETPLVPYQITICGLTELSAHARSGFSHAVSILDPDWPDPKDFAAYAPHRRVVWRFHDVIETGPQVAAPEATDVAAILDFGASLRAEQAGHVLIHCHAGISRSTATAVILMAQDNPGRELQAFAELARVRPRSWPNSRMIAMADVMLSRSGALLAELRRHQHRAARAYPEFADLLARYERTDPSLAA
jgi:predicted protein tyrosine phosphatase